jgi:hypothetical protein
MQAKTYQGKPWTLAQRQAWNKQYPLGHKAPVERAAVTVGNHFRVRGGCAVYTVVGIQETTVTLSDYARKSLTVSRAQYERFVLDGMLIGVEYGQTVRAHVVGMVG